METTTFSPDFSKHPCFNAESKHLFGRIHLAVAPKCNVQCNFCNRKFDCTNESRPGVTTRVLKPAEALIRLEEAEKKAGNLVVVGIAGPGDPFANPGETMETLERVHAKYPDKLLCVSSNGLNISDYIPRLAKLNVSHVTVTVNAVDPATGANIYEWISFGKKTYFGVEGAKLLLERQTGAIRELKRHGITVKVNTVVIPRVNEHHVCEVAKYVSGLGADIQNCIALIPVKGTPYEDLYEPSASDMRIVRAKTSVYIKQMKHCARCRADAAGLLGEDTGSDMENEPGKISFNKGKYVAVATSDGLSIDTHLGMVTQLAIYTFENEKIRLIENRDVSSCRNACDRWNTLTGLLADCSVLLVSRAGSAPLRILKGNGFAVEAVEGDVTQILTSVFKEKRVPKNTLRLTGFCDSGRTCC
ncbi:MAG: radical SAM protein [Tannerella sp.]|jgi:nitrogen fixation protein NifB|nr:radical SAM protein [Tannerella sp.]